MTSHTKVKSNPSSTAILDNQTDPRHERTVTKFAKRKPPAGEPSYFLMRVASERNEWNKMGEEVKQVRQKQRAEPPMNNSLRAI